MSFTAPCRLQTKSVLQLTFRQCKQYRRTLHSDAKFLASVFTDPPPSPATTENREGVASGRRKRGVPQLSRTNVRRVAPLLLNLVALKMTREDTHLDTDVLWEADERHSDLARKRWTDVPSCSFLSFFKFLVFLIVFQCLLFLLIFFVFFWLVLWRNATCSVSARNSSAFQKFCEHTFDNSPTDPISSSLKWWSSMHGVPTLYSCGVVLFDSPQCLSTHFFA